MNNNPQTFLVWV